MRITVRLFALIRDRAGVSQTILELTPGSTVTAAIESLARQFPAVETLLPRIGYAVNQSYVDRETVLHDGDELALIPPVSGG
jgi:molybdopterin converting factor subunit 1